MTAPSHDPDDVTEEEEALEFECASCCGSAAMADGSRIVVEDWV